MRRVTFSIPWPLTGAETREIIYFACQVTWLSYLSLLLVENIDPGFVTTFFDLNIFLWAAIFFAAASSIWSMGVPESHSTSHNHWPAVVSGLILALATMAAVWHATDLIGKPVKLIAPLAGLAVLGLSILVYHNGGEDRASS